MPYNLDMFARSKMASALKVGDEVEVIGGDKVVTAKVTGIKGKWIEIEGFPRKFSIGTGKYRGNGALVWEKKEMEVERVESIYAQRDKEELSRKLAEYKTPDHILYGSQRGIVVGVEPVDVSKVTAFIKRIQSLKIPEQLKSAVIRTAAEYLARNI